MQFWPFFGLKIQIFESCLAFLHFFSVKIQIIDPILVTNRSYERENSKGEKVKAIAITEKEKRDNRLY